MRLPKPPTPWQRVRLGRQNLLAAFEEQAFDYEFVSMRLLAREVFLCNTPESVQFAFSTHNDSFERKSPATASRSSRCSATACSSATATPGGAGGASSRPIVHISRLSEFVPVMVETARKARASAGPASSRPPRSMR